MFIKVYTALLLLSFFVSCQNHFNLDNGFYVSQNGIALFIKGDTVSFFNPVQDKYYLNKQKNEIVINSSVFGCFVPSKNSNIKFEIISNKCFILQNADTCLLKNLYFQSSCCLFEIPNPVLWDSIIVRYDSTFNADILIDKKKLNELENINSFINLESEIQLLLSNKINRHISLKSSLPSSIWEIYSNGVLVQKKEVRRVPYYLVGIRSIIYKNFKVIFE